MQMDDETRQRIRSSVNKGYIALVQRVKEGKVPEGLAVEILNSTENHLDLERKRKKK